MMIYNEPTQAEIDNSWEALKQEYLANGFTEVEFLRAQLAMTMPLGGNKATELREAKKKAYKVFDV